jgi:hypothetical protein
VVLLSWQPQKNKNQLVTQEKSAIDLQYFCQNTHQNRPIEKNEKIEK